MRPLALLLLASLVACASAPPPPARPAPAPPPVVVEVVPEPAPPDACAALAGPLRTLRVLAAMVSLGRSMSIRPLRPDLFVAELDAGAARARAARADDAELAKLAAETGGRLARIAVRARAFGAARREADGEAARIALLDEMERGELLVALGEQRCGGGEGAPGHLPAAALERTVRGGFGGFKGCYDTVLRRAPGLQGTVRVRFAVARDGTVSDAADADRGPPDPLAWSTGANARPLGDPDARACVVAAFKRLVFPRPRGGTFSATYAIELGTTR